MSESPATDSSQVSRANSVEAATPTANGIGSSNNNSASGVDGSSSDHSRKIEAPGSLERRIADDPYDADAWLTLLNDAEREGEVPKVRDVYERFLKVFPTSPRYWIQYAEFELKHHHFTEVESIFQRCLRSVLSVELWKYYLNYIRRINTGPEAKDIITKAYDFVLQHVGLDRDSGAIWGDYLFFLKSGQTQNTWEEQQKMDAMRRVFQKAVCIPLNNVENIWRDYDSFENGLNKLTAKKFLQERSAGYMTARMMWKELRKLTDGINKNLLPRPVKWTERELHQLEQWKRYIRWERSNPLNLEDQAAFSARVAWTYKQALLSMRFYPEVWFEAATYFQEIGRADEAVALLKNACEIMPTSFLLHFAYAEMEENRKNMKESRVVFETLVKNLTEKIDDMNRRVDEEVQAAKTALQAEQQLLDGASSSSSGKKVRDIEEVDGEMRERERDELKKRTKELQQYEKLARKEVEEMIKGCGLAWIMFMQFVRRTEGTSQWRQIFGRARRSNGCPYQVYIAAALMEYHCTKDPSIAGKVFELGYKLFGDETAYVDRYLEFLIELNDDSNARALFERALINMSSEKARPLWEKFSDYENKYGDLGAINKVEKRRREVYPNDSVLERFAARYSYDSLKVIEEMDMGLSIRKNIHVPALTDFSSDFPPPPPVNLDDAARPGRRPLMEPVHPDLYPRPDFAMWNSYRVYPEMIRKPAASNLSRDRDRDSGNSRPSDMDTVPHSHHSHHSHQHSHAGDRDRERERDRDRDGHDTDMRDAGPGFVPKSAVPPHVPSPQTGGSPSHQPNHPVQQPPPQQQQQQQQLQLQQQQQQQQPPQGMPPAPLNVPGWSSGPHGLIPDALAFFLSNLPPPSSFNGPALAAQDILELVRAAQIPAGQAMIIPPPVPVPPMPSQSGPGGPHGHGDGHRDIGGGAGRGRDAGFRGDREQRDFHGNNRDRDRDSRDSRGDRGGRGGFRGRGGPGGGGGRGGMKRKGREYDDDAGGGGGGGGGGGDFRGQMPGVNRPPEYDLFRSRQQRKANME
ncbi:mRNA 3'-end-processing protein rna14 [Dissophora globulifera]|uniref:mRNA 3'-end-processing protein rna14 n=1 Tax=Dissophora globulifera TaxID=979702 RepID=A0A9P6RR33_9FUNG|nr:mRNA 3'-end-processing protein rna14 [Dissophora globulifera]